MESEKVNLDKLPEIMTVRQLAEFVQLAEVTIRKNLLAKNIIGFKVGKDWRITKGEVQKWIEKRQ